MKMKNIVQVISCIMLFFSSSIIAQQDNGNVFELTWKAKIPQHYGDASEMGIYAPGSLDIDQDGDKEFLIYDHFKFSFTPVGRLQLWENVENDSFKLVWMQEYPDYLQKDNPGAGLTVADLDKDGMQEVLISVEDVIYIYEWDGTTFESGAGLPDEPTRILYTVFDKRGQAFIRQLIVRNLDPDPDLEIFMGYGYNKGLYCVIGSFPGSDLTVPEWKLEFIDDFYNVTLSDGGGYRVGGAVIDDFDGDGNMEIFTCHREEFAATRVYENDGIDNYVIKHTNVPDSLIINPPFDGAFANPVFHDFDGDGVSEFVISDIHGHIFLITAESSDNFQDFGPSAWIYLMNWPQVPAGGFMRSGYMGDLDQDGKTDVYYNDYRAQAILDLEYQGGEITDPDSWIPYEIYPMPGRRFGKVGPVGDLDGDGFEELVCNMGGLKDGQNLHIIESQHRPTTVKENDPLIAADFALFDNYPNPFNPTTTISYQISGQTTVEIAVYDMIGKKVRTLVNSNRQAGTHKVIWDGRNDSGQQVASGVYVYQIKAGKFTDSKKMVFMQ